MDQSVRCKGPGGAGGQHVSLWVLVIACAVFDLPTSSYLCNINSRVVRWHRALLLLCCWSSVFVDIPVVGVNFTWETHCSFQCFGHHSYIKNMAWSIREKKSRGNTVCPFYVLKKTHLFCWSHKKVPQWLKLFIDCVPLFHPLLLFLGISVPGWVWWTLGFSVLTPCAWME